MQSLKPWEREKILSASPEATEADIDELEELAAERFTIDPDRPPPEDFGLEGLEDRLGFLERRMAELSRKMFGSQ